MSIHTIWKTSDPSSKSTMAKNSFRVGLRVSEGIGHNCKLITGMSTDLTLSLGCHGSEHYDDRVISGCSLDKLLKFRCVKLNHWSLQPHLYQLLNPFTQRCSLCLENEKINFCCQKTEYTRTGCRWKLLTFCPRY